MEFALKRSSGDGVIKEEKRSESNGGDHHDHEAPSHHQEPENTTVDQVSPMKITARSIVETAPSSAASTKKEEVDELESARAKMGEVREENQRLKMCLDRIMKEYEALQMQFHVIVEQETKDDHDQDQHHIMNEESTEELVSLSLGRVPIMSSNNIPKSEDKTKVTTTSTNNKRARSSSVQDHEEEMKEDELALGLDCKFETSKSGSTTDQANNNNNNNNNAISPTNSSQIVVAKEDEAAESWPPSKVLKNTNTTSNNNGNKDRDHSGDQDEVSQQNPAKKARVCVRARCDTPTMNDGCQWRKYGQKISKGNPCPRAYYRCTVAPNCPVRKQVQRCADDRSILITTYEGTHNHPLPLSATAMASTTSAAASMLLSGSSSSSIASSSSMMMASSTSSSALHNNFYFSDSIMKPRQFYLSNPALSPSPSHPTITLDLTNPNHHHHNILPSSSSTTKFLTPSSSSHNNSNTLSFTSSSELPNALGWTNNGFLTAYNNQVQPYAHHHSPNMNMNMNMNILGRQVPIMPIMPSHHQNSNSLPADTIAAATKVITADPTFQSALAAALTSIIGTSSNTSTTSSGITTQQGLVAQNLGFNKIHSKWGPASFTKTASSGAGSSSSFMFLQPSLGFSASKSASAAASLSPGDNHNHSNNDRDNSNS